MTEGEFAWIDASLRPLARSFPGARDLRDDVAILPVAEMDRLVVSTDALVESVHFRPEDPPDLVGRKALRTSLSDMAACGARPWAYTLALAVGARRDGARWVSGIAAGLARDHEEFGIGLAGGDTVRSSGPSMLCVTIFGIADTDRALGRGNARIGDDIWVSGTIGDAALGLRVLDRELTPGREEADYLAHRYLVPDPRVALGRAVTAFANAAIDISDGLLQDLGHVSRESAVGATVWLDMVPVSDAAAALIGRGQVTRAQLLAAGDDYELLFTAPASVREEVRASAGKAGTPVARIGIVGQGTGVTVLDRAGSEVPVASAGYRHA